MQSTRIIYNTRAAPAWCRRRRSCRSGASSCGAGSRWSACTPSSQPVIPTRCLPTTRTLHLTPREHRHVLRLHWPVSCLIFDVLLPRQSGQPPQWHLPCLSRVRKHFTHPLSHPHLCSSSPSSDRAFSSASAPCSPVAIRAQRASYIRKQIYSTTNRSLLRARMTRSTRRAMWNSSSTVIRKPTIPSNSSLCELKTT